MNSKNYAKLGHQALKLKRQLKRLKASRDNWEKCASAQAADIKRLFKAQDQLRAKLRHEMQRNGVLMKENLRLNDLCR